MLCIVLHQDLHSLVLFLVCLVHQLRFHHQTIVEHDCAFSRSLVIYGILQCCASQEKKNYRSMSPNRFFVPSSAHWNAPGPRSVHHAARVQVSDNRMDEVGQRSTPRCCDNCFGARILFKFGTTSALESHLPLVDGPFLSLRGYKMHVTRS